MYLKLPYAVMTKSNSCLVNKHSFPYSLDFYNPFVEGDIYTLKITLDEVCDIARRYVIIYPATVQVVEGEKENQFRCLVNDDASGISRGVLERIGYVLEESEFSPFGIYWISLKTREEKRRKK